VEEGDKLTLRVVKMDIKNRRLGLSLKKVNSAEYLDQDWSSYSGGDVEASEPETQAVAEPAVQEIVEPAAQDVTEPVVQEIVEPEAQEVTEPEPPPVEPDSE
jgi:ribosomal protein S1